MRTQCRRLARFIRLGDFMCMDALHDLAVGATRSLLAMVSPGDVSEVSSRQLFRLHTVAYA